MQSSLPKLEMDSSPSLDGEQNQNPNDSLNSSIGNGEEVEQPLPGPDLPEDLPPDSGGGDNPDLPESDLPDIGGEESKPESGSPQDKPQEESPQKMVTYLKSKVNALRVRSGAGNYSVLGYLDQGDMLEHRGESGNYYLTVFKEVPAYVHKQYCEKVEIKSESTKVERAISVGATLMGHPYVWGSQRYHWGNGKLNTNFVSGQFDCSALVQYVYYHSNGVLLDLTSRAQSQNGVEVKRQDLKRGDLLFFTNESRKNKVGIERIGHVGIYFGDNYILHTASDHAVIEQITKERWNFYVTARRVV